MIIYAVGEPASILSKEVFLVSKDFYPHRQSRWFIVLKSPKKEHEFKEFMLLYIKVLNQYFLVNYAKKNGIITNTKPIMTDNMRLDIKYG